MNDIEEADSYAEELITDIPERLRDGRGIPYGDLRDFAADASRLLYVMHEAWCSLKCPSHWRTGERPPHTPECIEASAILNFRRPDDGHTGR